VLLCKQRLTAGFCQCNYTYGDLLFIQVYSDPPPVHCNTVSGKLKSLLPSAALHFATLQMPHGSDSASLPGYASWLELQYQQAARQLNTVKATLLPAVHGHLANLPLHSHVCSQHSLGLECLPHGTNTNQVHQSAPPAHINGLPINQAASACPNWNGISFPLPGSSVCTGDREGFVAGLGSTGSSLSPDHLAMLAQQSVLQASGHSFNGGEAL